MKRDGSMALGPYEALLFDMDGTIFTPVEWFAQSG